MRSVYRVPVSLSMKPENAVGVALTLRRKTFFSISTDVTHRLWLQQIQNHSLALWPAGHSALWPSGRFDRVVEILRQALFIHRDSQHVGRAGLPESLDVRSQFGQLFV